MQTNHQLIQTICTLSPHGLQVQWDGSIWTIDTSLPSMSETARIAKKMTISFAIYLVQENKAKLLLHSTSKLTESILEGGKVPIVELAKISFKDKPNWYVRDGDAFCSNYPQLSFYFKDGGFYADDGDMMRTVHYQLELFNFMIAEGFNLFNLSEEYFTEKSTLKN